jgi:uncharacterized protein (TIGR02099 family)
VFLKHSFAFLKHGSLWTYRAATLSVLVTGLIFFTLVLGLRYYLLPHIDEYRERIAEAISASVGQRVTIGSISGSWQGYRPEMSLMDVKVLGTDGRPALAFERVTTVLSWLSLISAELQFDSLAVYGPSLEVKRDAAGAIWIAGVAIKPQENSGDGFSRWLLAQRQVLVRDAAIVWLDEMRGAPQMTLNKVDFRLDRDGSMHRFGVTAMPPADVASPLAVRGQFVGTDVRDLPSWKAKIYAEIGYADLAAAQAWIPVPLELSSGVGSLRVWLELDGDQLGAATADVRLTNVKTRLARDLPELVLSEVQGRLGWTQSRDRTEFSATSLGIIVAGGPALAPMQGKYSYSTLPDVVRHSELHVSNLDLTHVATVAEFLPIDDGLRARLVRTAPAGTVEDALLSWDGDWGTGSPYTAKAKFNSLSARPDGMFPGLHGVKGQVMANEGGGTASLTVAKGSFALPNVFTESIPIDFLTADAVWVVKPDAVQLEVKNASFTNEDVAGTVSGSYFGTADGRGSIDLNGSLLRAEARQIWRYLPAVIAGPQAWLKRALLAGHASETRFRVKGALKDFPFKDDKKGVFEIRTKASGVTVDFADGWPPVTGVNGDVVFHGARMEIKGSGAIQGLQLSEVQISHSELGKRGERLLVKGAVRGFSSDFLRFMATSPVAGYLNHAMDDMKAIGVARLNFELGLALAEIKDSTVKGDLIVEDNEVSVPRLPALARAGAHIAFTKNDLKLTDGHALMFGAPVSFTLSSQPDGSIISNIAGTIEMSRARALWKHAALARFDGQTSWRGTITMRNKMLTGRLDSNLVGLASSLPPPFAKKAASSLPLHLELREQAAGRRRVLDANLDRVASTTLLLDETAPGGVSRGMLSIGGVASLPASDGIWIKGKLESVDTEGWQKLVSGGSGQSTPELAGVDLEIGVLDFNRRRFHDIRIYATPDDETWQIKLGGREVVGDLYWTSGGDGNLVARLSKLMLPALASQIEPAGPAGAEPNLPSVDLVAENFNYEGKDFGRLLVLAQPEFSGWQLRRLEVTNPESKFVMSGHWSLGAMSHTDVSIKLDASDLGKLFARLGWPNAVKGGSATLAGPIKWSGNPTRFDIPSLSGQLKLEAKDGRFQEIEPGVAKLLGILSLQALPKRANLDFRDVFSKGFSFERIGADVNIVNGVADTQNFVMQGSAARVAMQGQVDLGRETQKLSVRVTPSLSSGIAIAGAIVNPAIGIAALIAQKALRDPFSKLVSFDYTISGTWGDPIIARVARVVPQVEREGR